MDSKSLEYLVIILVVVLIVYFFLTILQSNAEISQTDTNTMTAGTNYTLSHTVDTGYAYSLSNATLTCTSGNYTTNYTHITLIAGQICKTGLSYNFNYTYQTSLNVLGINFSFIVVLAIIAMFGLVVTFITKRKK